MNDQSALDKTPAVQMARMKSSEAFVETLCARRRSRTSLASLARR